MTLWMLFLTMTERMYRRQYALEREYAEWFDLGGES